MERLVITGLSGLLGSNIAVQCRDRWAITGWTWRHPIHLRGIVSERVDVTDAEAVHRAIVAARPDIVVHTAGLTNVDECEAAPELARALNVDAAAHVARATVDVGCALVHVSTDHLFGGDRACVVESEPPRPVNEYARTKLHAEQIVGEIAPTALVVRTNFFGWGLPHRSSLSDWVIGSLRGGQAIEMFTDVFFTPILISELVHRVLALRTLGASGIVHVAGGERLSKYEFGRRIAERFGEPAGLIRPRSVSGFPFRAPRPRDMSLDTAHSAALLRTAPPSVDRSIDGLIQQEREGRRLDLARSVLVDTLADERS